MNLGQRCQQVFDAMREGTQRSLRKIAAATGIPKSSVHRHKQTIARRDQYPEASLWETVAGQEWLRLLVCGAIYVFGIKCGIGAETRRGVFLLVVIANAGGGVSQCLAESGSRGQKGHSGISTATAKSPGGDPDSH